MCKTCFNRPKPVTWKQSWKNVTDVYCTLLFWSPFVFSEVTSPTSPLAKKRRKKEEKKNIIPCLAGTQVRNVPSYLGLYRAKMSFHWSKIPALQCMQGCCTSLSVPVTWIYVFNVTFKTLCLAAHPPNMHVPQMRLVDKTWLILSQN